MWLTKVPYCVLPNNGKQLQAFPYEISLIQTLILLLLRLLFYEHFCMEFCLAMLVLVPRPDMQKYVNVQH